VCRDPNGTVRGFYLRIPGDRVEVYQRDEQAVQRIDRRRARILDAYVDEAFDKIERDRRLRSLTRRPMRRRHVGS
jgi:hypothetical protein